MDRKSKRCGNGHGQYLCECRSGDPRFIVLLLLGATALLPACGTSVGSAASSGPDLKTQVSSIDPRVQLAATHALSNAAQPTDLIALKASTGQILAFASHGNGLTPDDALVGEYPKGSTFKVVTAMALLERGFSPATPVTCPASIRVGGKVLSTFDGNAGNATDLQDAFAQSCNTAFASLGSGLPNAIFAQTAAQFGLGIAPHLGRPAFGGRIATPATEFDRATVASDGGSTLVSPLALATLAATVDSGRLHEPSLVAGQHPDASDRRGGLKSETLDELRVMMAAVVTDGTAANEGLPPQTYAKTGTAEFTNRPQPRVVYAWIIGYHGDMAFAVLVIGGAQGGIAAGPVAAKFLDAIS